MQRMVRRHRPRAARPTLLDVFNGTTGTAQDISPQNCKKATSYLFVTSPACFAQQASQKSLKSAPPSPPTSRGAFSCESPDALPYLVSGVSCQRLPGGADSGGHCFKRSGAAFAGGWPLLLYCCASHVHKSCASCPPGWAGRMFTAPCAPALAGLVPKLFREGDELLGKGPAGLPSPSPLNANRPRKAVSLSGAVEEFGSFLLSRAKMRSIIGEEELNCRVRNGIGCTLYSVAAKSCGRAPGAVPALFRGLAPPELPSKYN